MSLLQGEYIQKSRIFLLPLTAIKKDRIYKPTNTYIAAPNLVNKDYPTGISINDQILITVFTKDYERRERDNVARLKLNSIIGSWEKFETDALMSNRNFIGLFETKEDYVYTFDLTDWSGDWYNFIKGAYSEFSPEAKDIILKYRWASLKPTEQKKLYCYLYPYKDECIRSFARELNTDPKQKDVQQLEAILRETKELCSKPHIAQETYVYKGELQTPQELISENQD